MRDVENGLGLKNIRELVRREICGIYEMNSLSREQKRKYKRAASEISKELKNYPQNCQYVRNDSKEKMIKNCRGV